MPRHYSSRKRNTSTSGSEFIFQALVFIILCFLLIEGGNFLMRVLGTPISSPTPETGYTGNCHHWTRAKDFINQDTCIWGVVVYMYVGQGVWMHFSEEAHYYSDFAVSINSFTSGYSSYTGKQLDEIYSGHCVEVDGKVTLISNKYQGITTEQPIMNVKYVNHINFCDNKFIK